jgi:hypothetical protein
MKVSTNVDIIQQVRDSINIDLFYNLTIWRNHISMQGQYEANLVVTLRKAGFEGFTIDEGGFTTCARMYGDTKVEIVLA